MKKESKKIWGNRIAAFVMGGVTFGMLGVQAASSILSSQVAYNSTTVKNALDDLYSKASSIPKLTPTLTLSSYSVTPGCYESVVTYTYDGDGAISCTNGAYATCTVDSENSRITFINSSNSEDITITASAGAKYSGLHQTISVNGCLAGETLVEVWDEKKKKKTKKKLKDVKPGEMLFTYDTKTGEFKPSKVKSMNIDKSREVYNLYVEDEIITLTGDHPIYIPNLGNLYVNLLKPGTEIVCLDGKIRRVIKIEKISLDREKEMYCPIFEDDSKYFAAGNIGIVCASIVSMLITFNGIVKVNAAVVGVHSPCNMDN